MRRPRRRRRPKSPSSRNAITAPRSSGAARSSTCATCPDTTEVEIVAYPLDGAQRPDQNAPTLGRFIVALPGYVEPLDFPAGRFVTLRGHVAGSRSARIDEHDLVFPLVGDATVHLWPVNFPYDEPRVNFSLGVGVGVH